MNKITIKAMNKELRRLMKENPDYIYSYLDDSDICSYTTGLNGKGCLFGQALINLGLSKHHFDGYDTSVIYDLWDHLVDRELAEADPERNTLNI